MRRYPHLIEINARAFVTRMSEKYRRKLTLATIPDDEWQTLAQRGFDLVWLMGVWQRSKAARQQALRSESLRRAMESLLPGLTTKDVAGSPYAVYSYTLDSPMGTEEDLAVLRSKLNALDMGLVLDFVPNHLAMDHPWTLTYPDRFVQGRPSDVERHPDWFFRAGSEANLAHGRDPYFAPWADTVQVNFFSTGLRRALASELGRIAGEADGVRCDMAMLGLNEVFEKVWGEVIGTGRRPRTEFWSGAIAEAKKRNPGLVLMAEVYWGYEDKLQQLGFDFTYDKTLYDGLRYSSALDIIEYLKGHTNSLERSVHFIENHDEERAPVAFGRERSMAAAIVLGTVPGMRFYHGGQSEGRTAHIPVQLAREPEGTDDPDIREFYTDLLSITDMPAFHDGRWALLEIVRSWENNESYRNLMAWEWRTAERWKVVAINYSPQQSQGWLRLGTLPELPDEVIFLDELTDTTYVRNKGELGSKGLYVDLKPYQAHIMDAAVG